VPWRITLAYDGTDFQGWQAQAPGSRTVQGEVEAALARLCAGALVRVAGAGRTDTGVHAVGQVASFELPRAMSPRDLLRALNGLLPRDVRVLDAAGAPDGFHARKSAVSKLYRYVFDMGAVQIPTRRRYAGHVPGPLDRDAMAAALEVFRGRHDFASLASAGGSARTTVRTITRADLEFEGDTATIEVEADGFLRKMVRSLVGGVLAAGRGTHGAASLRAVLEARDRAAWPAPADARGLVLVRVDYPPGALRV
jgi:tRNA pseudouridine38-40 synthase